MLGVNLAVRRHVSIFMFTCLFLLCICVSSLTRILKMSNEIALPQQFKDAAREKILTMFIDLIPKEQLDEYIAKEVKAFFETETILTVTPTRIEVENPQYDKTRNDSYGNQKYLSRECVAFGSKMTPFRQLAWTVIHEHIKPKFEAQLTAEDSDLKKQFDEQLGIGVGDIAENNRKLVAGISTTMVSYMFRQTFADAVNLSHFNLKQALQNIGVDYSKVQSLPNPWIPPQ